MKPVSFSSRIERLDDGSNFHVLPVAEDLAAPILETGSRRILLTIGDCGIRRALLGPEMGRFLIIGKATLRELGLRLGSPVEATLQPDPDPDAIDLTEEFEVALEQDPEARARWETFTVGKKRSLSHYLTSAKRPETRLKRAVEIAEKIRTHTLHGDRRPEEGCES